MSRETDMLEELAKQLGSLANHVEQTRPETGDIIIRKRWGWALGLTVPVLVSVAAAGGAGYLGARDQATAQVHAIKANTDAVKGVAQSIDAQSALLAKHAETIASLSARVDSDRERIRNLEETVRSLSRARSNRSPGR